MIRRMFSVLVAGLLVAAFAVSSVAFGAGSAEAYDPYDFGYDPFDLGYDPLDTDWSPSGGVSWKYDNYTYDNGLTSFSNWDWRNDTPRNSSSGGSFNDPFGTSFNDPFGGWDF